PNQDRLMGPELFGCNLKFDCLKNEVFEIWKRVLPGQLWRRVGANFSCVPLWPVRFTSRSRMLSLSHPPRDSSWRTCTRTCASSRGGAADRSALLRHPAANLLADQRPHGGETARVVLVDPADLGRREQRHIDELGLHRDGGEILKAVVL